jgi:hypothetical protein
MTSEANAAAVKSASDIAINPSAAGNADGWASEPGHHPSHRSRGQDERHLRTSRADTVVALCPDDGASQTTAAIKLPDLSEPSRP